jgi:hypothetical protein
MSTVTVGTSAVRLVESDSDQYRRVRISSPGSSALGGYISYTSSGTGQVGSRVSASAFQEPVDSNNTDFKPLELRLPPGLEIWMVRSSDSDTVFVMVDATSDY